MSLISASRIVSTAVAAISGVALAGAAHAAEPLTFQMSWRAQAEFGGYYQALAKGFYADCGVDMTIRDGAPGMDSAQLLSAGAVDVALVPQNDTVLQMNRAGFPARAVMAGLQKNLTILLYHEESGIKAPKDIMGKPVLLSQSTRTTVWPFLKAKYGFSDEQLRAYSGQVATWMADKNSVQQGVATQEPFRIKAETGKFPSFFLLADMGYAPYTAIVAVSQKLIDTKPAAVQCLVDASRKGWADFMKDPKPGFEAILKRNPQTNQELLAYTHQALRSQGIAINEETAKLGVGVITDARWKQHFDLLVSSGVFPADFDYKSTYTTRFIQTPIN
ncbi:MAG: ABC transporter substrate-binding protein [Moraxellaceae bacterium]|nr:ABC transporter substrate-binding protein [Moraxellaceae bacterium]